MTIAEILTTVATVASLIGSIAAAFIALYVKAAIGPIVTRLENHQTSIHSHDTQIGNLYGELRGLAERAARLEGRDEGKPAPLTGGQTHG